MNAAAPRFLPALGVLISLSVVVVGIHWPDGAFAAESSLKVAAVSTTAALPFEATATTASLAAIPPPNDTLLRLWLSLPAAPSVEHVHADIKRIVVDERRGNHASACAAAIALHDRVLGEASRLFYAPVRKNPNLDAIGAFLTRWVRGPAPLFVIAAEVFAPAAGFRDLGLLSCTQAGRFDVAARFLHSSALAPEASQQRRRLALLRWRLEGDLRPLLWLVDVEDATLSATLLRLAATADAGRPALLRDADQRARGAADKALLARFLAYLAQPGAAVSPAAKRSEHR
jgi:hypothetical protein